MSKITVTLYKFGEGGIGESQVFTIGQQAKMFDTHIILGFRFLLYRSGKFPLLLQRKYKL